MHHERLLALVRVSPLVGGLGWARSCRWQISRDDSIRQAHVLSHAQVGGEGLTL